MKKECYSVKILNLLMTHEELSTYQICEMVGCERKTVYRCMDVLETSGFGIEVIPGRKKKESNRYRFVGVYDFAR